MLFNSLIFMFIFLPTILFIYYVIDIRMRGRRQSNPNKRHLVLISILVFFSIAFFGWDNIGHVKVLIFLILFNYIIGMLQKN